MNQAIFNTSAGITGAVITYAFGEWSSLLSLFLILIVADYVTGIIASIKEGTGLNSEVGWWGLIKKILMITAVFVGHQADKALAIDLIMYGTLFAFMANEVISITENYGRLGLPLPKVFNNLIAVLKSKGGDTNGSK